MRAWIYRPGAPAAGGHITSSGFWHPGKVDGCPKCPDSPRNRVRRNLGARNRPEATK